MRGLGVLLLLVPACVPARRKIEGNIVRDIHFDGNDGRPFSGQTDYELRSGLRTRASGLGLTIWPFVYTVDPRPYRPDFLQEDAYRLETWYAHRGWFDAAVTGWEVDFVRPQTDRRAGVLDLVGHVDPGERSVVRSIRVEGVGDTLRPVVDAAIRHSLVREGDPYDQQALQDTRAAIVRHLQDHARPYARAELAATAYPEEHAVDVVYRVEPGIVGTVGPVRIVGEKAMKPRWIKDAARVRTGAPFQQAHLREAQRRLFDLGTFSVATVTPDLSDPTRPEVPIRVKVTEAKFRRLRLGVGFDYDSYVPIARTQLRLRDTNLLGQMWKADLGGSVGLGVNLGDGDVQSIPTWSVDFAVRDPRLFRQRAAVELSGAVTQDYYNGLWAFRRPEADLALVVRATDHVQLRFGPHAESYTFLGEFGPKVQAAQQRLFGIESDEAFVYELTSLDQHAQWDWRDDPVRTTRGSWYSVQLREALPLTPHGYGFFRSTGEARRFVPLRAADRQSAFPLTLAGRLAGTVIVPFAPGSPIPLPERAFLGGPTSLRGFRPNQVGPYTTLCTYDTVSRGGGFLGLGGDPVEEERVTRYHLPDGGAVSAQTSAEVRYDWVYGLLLSGFVDAGVLTNDVGSLGLDDLRFSAGLGTRYDTVVGPLRFDVSVRPLYAEDRGPTRFAQCRVGDDVPRTIDLVDNFVDRETSALPVAIVFYLTFGEAL